MAGPVFAAKGSLQSHGISASSGTGATSIQLAPQSSNPNTLFDGSFPDFVVDSGDTFDESSVNLLAQANSINDAGTLILGNSGLVTGALNVSGLLTVGTGGISMGANNSDSLVTGTVSGSTGLIKQGTGTLTISSNQSYTGTTQLRVGTLAIGNSTGISLAGALTQTGGTLAVAVTPTTASSLSASAITLTQGAIALNFAAGSYSATNLSLFNHASIAYGNIGVTATNAPSNLVVAVNQNGFSGSLATQLELLNPNAALPTGTTMLVSTPSTIALTASNTSARLIFLNSTTAGHSNLTTIGAGGPDSFAFFNQSSAANSTLNASNTIVFHDQSTAGSAIILGSGITVGFHDQSTAANAIITNGLTTFQDQASAGSATFSGAVTFSGASTAVAPHINGTLTVNGTTANLNIPQVNGAIVFGSGTNTTVTMDSDNSNSTLSSVSSLGTAAAGLTKNGTGTLTVSGSLSVSGPLTLHFGTVVLDGNSIANTANPGAITTINSIVVIGSDSAHSSAVFTGPISIPIGNRLSGYGSVQSGSGQSGTVLNGGQMVPGIIGRVGSMTVGAYAQGDNGSLEIQVNPLASSRLIVLGTASIKGDVTFEFQSASYSPATYLFLTADNIVGPGFASVQFINLPSGFSASIVRNATQMQMILAGPGSTSDGSKLFDGSFPDFVVASGQTVDVSSVNLQAQAHSINDAGTLLLGNGGLLTGALNVSGTLSLGSGNASIGADNSDSLISGTVSGSGGIIKQGTGTLTIASSQPYTGTTQLQAGTLAVTNPTGITLSGALTQTGGTIAVAVTPTTASGISANGITLTQGTLALNFAAGSYSAATLPLFSSGTIVFGDVGVTLSNAPSNVAVALSQSGVGNPQATQLKLLDPTGALPAGTTVFVSTPSNMAMTASGTSARVLFFYNTTAGSSTLTTNALSAFDAFDFYNTSSAANATLSSNSNIVFHDQSTAASATVNGTGSASVGFRDQSTAANVVVTAGTIAFQDQASAGSATLNGAVSFTGSSTAVLPHINGSVTTNTSTAVMNFGSVNGSITNTNSSGTVLVLGSDNSNSAITTISSPSASSNIGLTKAGNGTMTVSGTVNMRGVLDVEGGNVILNGASFANSSSGTTSVQNATLVIGAAGHTGATFTGPITVNAGGILSGLGSVISGVVSGQTYNGTIFNNGTVVPAQTGAIGAFNTSAYIQGDSGTLQIEVSPLASSRLVVDNTAIINGSAVFNFDAGSYSAATYTFLTAANIVGGGFSSAIFNGVPSGFSASLTSSATQYQLVLTGSGGGNAGSSLFDGSFPDFVVANGSTVDVTAVSQVAQANSITDAGALLIGNSGLVTNILNVSGALSVGTAGTSMGANNSNSLITGTVSGTGGIVKQGTGTLTISSNQTFTGLMDLRDGTLAIGNSAGITLAGGLRQIGGTLAIAVTPTTASGVSASTISLLQGTVLLNFASGAYSATTLSLFNKGTISYGPETVTANNAPTNLVTTLFRTSDTGPVSLKLIGLTSALSSGTTIFVSTPASIAVTSSGNPLIFQGATTAGSSTLSGPIDFYNTSSAGNAALSSTITFHNSSTAGSATLSGAGGNTAFRDQSSAGNASVNTQFTTFFDSATGGTAHVTGAILVSSSTATLAIGSVNGSLTWGNAFGTTVVLGGDNSNSTLSVALSTAQSPNAGFTKVGNGTMTTSGFGASGPLSVQGGTAILNGSSLANSMSSAFSTVQNATLVIGDAGHASSTFTGPISVGSGGTLSGMGTIQSGSFNSQVLSGTVINNGTVAPGQTGTVGALAVAAYAQTDSGILEIELNPSLSDRLIVGGASFVNGAAVFNFDAGSYGSNTYTFLTASSIGGGGFSTTTFNNLPTGTTASVVTSATQIQLILSGAGNNNSGLLFDGSNPDFIIGTGATVDVTSVSTPATAHSITDMGTLLLGSGGLTTGALNVSGTLSLGSGNATVGGDNSNSLISGTISGSGGLTKAGSGMLTITGTASYTGSTTIQSGVLQFGNGGASGTIAGAIVDNGILAFNNTGGVVLSNTISGTGALTRTGSGYTALTGTNTYSGGTTVSDGLLFIGLNTATGSVAGNIDNEASLFFYRSNDYTFGGTISGAGTVFKYGAGTLTLTGANTNNGGFVVQSGTVEAASSQALGTSTFELYGTGSKLQLDNGVNIANDVQIDNSAFINVNGSDSATISGALIGSAPFEKDGTGTLTLNHDNTATYSGNISYHGTLVAGVSGAFGTGTVTDLGSRIVLMDGVAIDNRINLVDDMTVTQDGGIALMSGSIGESGGSWNLIKSGSGILLLTGNSSFTGLTTVSGGILQVEGSIAGSRGVIVESGATLEGSGTVGALTVNSGGRVAPGEPGTTGTLTADGNVTLASGSTLLIDFSSSAADRLTVNGVLNAGGSLGVSNVGGYTPHYGDMAIVASANSIIGAFDPLPDTIGGVLMPTLSIVNGPNGQQAVLKIVAQSFFTQFTATTADQTQVATALDGARASHFADMSGLYNAIDPLTGSTLSQALENLAPDAERAIGEVGNMQTEVFSGMLWQHLGDVGGGSGRNGFRVDASNLKLALASVSPESNETQQFVLLGSGLSTNPGGGNDAVSVTPAGGEGWLGLPGGSGGFLSGSSLNGSVVIGGGGGKADVRGFVIGAGLDFAVGDNLVIGGSLGMAQSSAALRATPATLQDDSIQGAAYARYDFAGKWILEGFAGYGGQTIQTRRLVTVGGTTTLISGHTSGSAPAFGFYVGKAFDVPLGDEASLVLVPSASVQYLQSQIDPFTETGGPAAMTFAGWSEETTLGRFGMDARTSFDLGGVRVTPAAHLFWVDDLSGSNGSIQAGFAAAPASIMAFAIAPHDNSWGELGFGTDFDLGTMLGSQAALSARYDATVGRDQIQYSAWTGRLMIRF